MVHTKMRNWVPNGKGTWFPIPDSRFFFKWNLISFHYHSQLVRRSHKYILIPISNITRCNLVQVLAVLLYSLFLISSLEISTPVFSVVLAIFLVVYLVRIIGIYRLFTEEVTRSKLTEAPIINIVFNLLLFLYGGHES